MSTFLLYASDTWEPGTFETQYGPFSDLQSAQRAAEDLARVPLEWEDDRDDGSSTAYVRGWMYRAYQGTLEDES